jgi:carboxylesterase type B
VGEQVGSVRVFRGIPYATAPLGDLRWRPPQPPQPWTGVRDATQCGAPALQSETFSPRSAQSEDCLFLNVWTPVGASEQSRLPVLVWIHGGAFIQGSGAQPRYDGTELAKRGTVVVTINYRLGPLGLFAQWHWLCGRRRCREGEAGMVKRRENGEIGIFSLCLPVDIASVTGRCQHCWSHAKAQRRKVRTKYSLSQHFILAPLRLCVR